MSEPGNLHNRVVWTHRLRRMSGRDPSRTASRRHAVVGGYEWQGHHRTSRALARDVDADAA